MDMNNYLKSLNDKIRYLPEGYRKEILKDYKNHFEEGLLTGKTENDIACDLGDVDSIIIKISRKFFPWLLAYFINSIKFQVFNINKYN